MTEPISNFDLAELRDLFARFEKIGSLAGACLLNLYGPYNEHTGGWPILGSVDHTVVAGLLARLDAAEAKLAKIAKLTAPKNYVSLATLVEIKEIVDG